MTTIYCFVVRDVPEARAVQAVALADDGTLCAAHVSSNEVWAQMDLGLDSWEGRKAHPGDIHGATRVARYRELFPDGFELVWVEEPTKHPGVLEAGKLNAEQGRHHSAVGYGDATGVWVPDDDAPDGARELTREEAKARGFE